jgi:hypothetical protein
VAKTFHRYHGRLPMVAWTKETERTGLPQAAQHLRQLPVLLQTNRHRLQIPSFL